MPRKPARLGTSDVQRVVRAYQNVGISVRVTYQPDGSTVFEPVTVPLPQEAAGSEERAA
jgi:hypothetical protein